MEFLYVRMRCVYSNLAEFKWMWSDDFSLTTQLAYTFDGCRKIDFSIDTFLLCAIVEHKKSKFLHEKISHPLQSVSISLVRNYPYQHCVIVLRVTFTSVVTLSKVVIVVRYASYIWLFFESRSCWKTRERTQCHDNEEKLSIPIRSSL